MNANSSQDTSDPLVFCDPTGGKLTLVYATVLVVGGLCGALMSYLVVDDYGGPAWARLLIPMLILWLFAYLFSVSIRQVK